MAPDISGLAPFHTVAPYAEERILRSDALSTVSGLPGKAEKCKGEKAIAA
jgi:hypothetical protein